MPNAPKPIYQDEPTPRQPRKPRRKKYPRGKHPRKLTSQSKDVKLLRLEHGKLYFLTEAAQLMGITRDSLRCCYIYNKAYALPDYIEIIYDMGRATAIRRIGP